MRLLVALLVVLACAAVPARGAGDGDTARALAELKDLCDRGLVAPAICLEKQRVILGLAPSPATADVPAVEMPGPLPEGGATPVSVAYRSALGFDVELPPGWMAVAPDDVRAGFGTLRRHVEDGGATAHMLDRIEAQVLGDTTDFFAHGREQVQVQRAPALPPGDPAALARFCDRLEANASRVAGRRLRTHACGMRRVADAPSLFVERDALMAGTRTAQYWIPAPDGQAVLFVLTCADGSADDGRRDLDAIVASLRWR